MSEEPPPSSLTESDGKSPNSRAPEFSGISATFGTQLPNVVTVAVQQNVSTSIFSADEVAALRAADPEAALLWYRLIDRQQSHDHAIEAQTLRSESVYRILGISTALVVILAMSAVTAFAIFKDYPTTAAILGATTGIATVAGAFIRGRTLNPSPPSMVPPPTYPQQRIPTQAPNPPQ